jgi:nephrocystin-3
MGAERDYLVKFIFPQLRKLCESRGVTWGEVDLRWGITEKQSDEGQVLPICLAEIERSRPYFIGLLGERYGWIPDEIAPELVEQEPWLKEHLNHSVTELEILHGVLNDPEMGDKALFYFRDPNYIQTIAENELENFIEVPLPSDIQEYGIEEAQKKVTEKKEKLEALKERIRQTLQVRKNYYRDPQQLGEWVLSDLTAIINQLYPEGEQPSPLAQESMLHEAFAQSRARVYIGGEKYYLKLEGHINESTQPIVLVGESGSGKSALLANWGLRYRQIHPKETVLIHFIGASAASTDLVSMLRRLMTELKERFDLSDEVPETEEKLRSKFPNWLYRASAKGDLVLILDGLNQLDNQGNAQELDWLPPELPQNIKLILSTLPCRAMDVIKERGWLTLEVEPLTVAEREELVIKFLALYSKQLSPERRRRIAQDPQSENPLCLRLLLDELRQFGVYGKKLDLVIDRYLGADSIPEMMTLILARCERDYEVNRPKLVRDALSYLWAARRGLSEAELLDLLGEGSQPLPHRFWSPLSLALENSLVNRDGLLGFSHDYVRQAVENRYFKYKKSQRKVHTILADYFSGFEGTPNRKVDELPWQLAEARAWEPLYNILADIDFFQALHERSRIDLMTYWARVEVKTNFTRLEAYQAVVNHPEGVGLHVLNWLSLMYMDTGYFEQAMTLYKEQDLICRQQENMEALQLNLGNQAYIMQIWGKLEKAMEMHKEEERICRQLGNLDGLQRSLGNQAGILKNWGKLKEAMTSVKAQERICRNLGDLDGLQRSLGIQGLILIDWGKLEEAMSLHKEGEHICRRLGNLEGLQAHLGSQGVILRYWGKLKEAMTLQNEKERICRQLGILEGLSASLTNQANILYSWGKLDEALALHKEGEQIHRQMGNLDGLQKSLGNKAIILYNLGKLEEAMALHKEEERICRELGNLNDLGVSLGNQAAILRKWGKQEEALALHKEEERICRSLGNIGGLCSSLANQGLIYGFKGNKRKGLRLINQSLTLAKSHGYTALAREFEVILSRIHKHRH